MRFANGGDEDVCGLHNAFEIFCFRVAKSDGGISGVEEVVNGHANNVAASDNDSGFPGDFNT
jgi:hypothetical protein